MTGKCSAVHVILICLFLIETQAIEWDPVFKEGRVVYACNGQEVVFPWTCRVSTGERILSIRWTFQSTFSSDVIATFTQGNFLSAAEFQERVKQAGNAGIAMDHVTLRDNGNYTIAVSALNVQGDATTLHGMAYLQVADSLLAEGGEVKMTQKAEAVRNQDNRWSVALTCGQFKHIHTPPFPVYWTTPSGEVLKDSDDFTEGSYVLLLPNPVRGGNYSCEIPQLFHREACISAGQHVKVKNTIAVDEVSTRLTLLEAHQADLLQENEQLRAALANKTEHLASTVEMESRVASLENTVANGDASFTYLLDALTADRNVHVAFSAFITGGQNIPASRGSIIPFTSIITNTGGAFDNRSGTFTAPVDGDYFFAIDINISKDYSHLHLYRNAEVKVTADRDDNVSTHLSTNGVLRLKAGDVVTVKHDSTTGYLESGSESVFSGFLIA